MAHEHNQQNTCPYCPPKSNESILSSNAKTKIMSFLGVCGCLSCYVAMFPAILLGLIGIFGISQSATSSVLNAYMASALFQPVLVVSIIFLIAGISRYGKGPTWLSILGGIGVFGSMTFFMQRWFFTISFAFIALAYFSAYKRAGNKQLKLGFVLLLVVALISAIDAGRISLKISQPVNLMDRMTR